MENKKILEFGIINIDKPSGMTSFDVSNHVKKLLKARKTSHFGTLDPMVTGVLPVALNRACKLTGFFLGEDKEYIGEMRIHEDVPLEKIKKTIKEKFIGTIRQIPPVKSRVKRQERKREIKKFEILEKNGKNLSFKVECEGGTYIRKLIHDLGENLGIRAHMTKLRRTRAGIFQEKDSVKLKEISENFDKIIPAEEAIKKVYPVVQIKGDNLQQIFTGKPIHKKDLINHENFEKNKFVCVFSEKKFVGVYKIVNQEEIFAKSEFVFQPIKI